MIRLQYKSNKVIFGVSNGLTKRSIGTSSRSTARSSTTTTPSTPFKFKFIPAINNNKAKPATRSDSTPLSSSSSSSSSIKQKRLTSYSLPSRNILDKHEEIIKAKEHSQMETLNKVKEIIEDARERGIIKRTGSDQNDISVSTNPATTTTITETAAAASGSSIGTTIPKKKKKRTLRARKAVITLTPRAIEHLKKLLDLPEPKMIRVSTKNRGCSGTQYDLSYVSKPEKFDEIVEQDGVRIIIDSKALFSVVGSEMDWIDDQLNTKFIFRNPNAKGTCGCGESFML